MPKTVKGVYEKGEIRPKKELNVKGKKEVITFFKEKEEESTVEKLSQSRSGKEGHQKVKSIIEAV